MTLLVTNPTQFTLSDRSGRKWPAGASDFVDENADVFGGSFQIQQVFDDDELPDETEDSESDVNVQAESEDPNGAEADDDDANAEDLHNDSEDGTNSEDEGNDDGSASVE